jgi:hypothetical protein
MFTKDELKILSQVVSVAQVQGTIQTLPPMLATLIGIQRKIIAEIEKSEAPKEAELN